MKPLVLLDVDGVVNAYPRDGSEVHVLNWAGFKVIVGEDTIEALRSVFQGAHEVLWCSAWRGMANEEPLEFLRWAGVTEAEELGVITDGGGFVFNTGWKLDAVRASETVAKALEEGREVIWIEDFGLSLHDYGYMTPVLEMGITPIDTVEDGFARLMPKHLVGTALESTSDIGDRVWDEYIAMSREQEGGMG
jgi:hypothetical protein